MYIYINIYIYIYIYSNMYIYMYIYMHTYLYIYTYIHVHIYIYTYTHMELNDEHIHAYLYIYVCPSIFVYIRYSINVYTYIYTYTHIYTSTTWRLATLLRALCMRREEISTHFYTQIHWVKTQTDPPFSIFSMIPSLLSFFLRVSGRKERGGMVITWKRETWER